MYLPRNSKNYTSFYICIKFTYPEGNTGKKFGGR